MKLKPDELTANGYVQLEQLSHNELVPFIRTYMKKKTKYALFYKVSNGLLFAFAGYFFVYGFHRPGYSLGLQFTHLSYGLAIAFLLLPLHEYIHVLAYRSQGATNTSYGANLKKFYFMALADQFVANRREFEIVALAPFVTISTVLIFLLFALPSSYTLTLIAILLAHTAMCSGDFGLLSFFEYHQDRNPITYDDIENKISYFYMQPAEQQINK